EDLIDDPRHGAAFNMPGEKNRTERPYAHFCAQTGRFSLYVIGDTSYEGRGVATYYRRLQCGR
ncbi:MAG: hypothetical protein ACXWCE_19955, partial [Caldimonas sp.]